MRRINITPTWVGILPALLLVLQDGSDMGKRAARDELMRMAELADAFNKMIKKSARKTVKVAMLMVALAIGAHASDYVYDRVTPNEYTTENLMRLADNAYQSDVDKFFHKLDCYAADAEDNRSKVVCNDSGKTLERIDDPHVTLSPVNDDPLVIMIPAQKI